jgi:hypothetical protein
MVDATPSGIRLLLKVVFMKPGKRFGLSAEQKTDVWRRWKAGQTLHERPEGPFEDELLLAPILLRKRRFNLLHSFSVVIP